jgi:hypothetical protein
LLVGDNQLLLSEPVAPGASVGQTIFRFRSQVINTTDTKTLTLSSNAAVPYSVLGFSMAGPSPQYYAHSTDCPATLAPGAYCTIGVTFTPKVAAYRSAYLMISTTATDLPIKAVVTGTGVLAPQGFHSRSALDCRQRAGVTLISTLGL